MTITIKIQSIEQPEWTFTSEEVEIIVGRPKYRPIHIDLSPDKKVSRPHLRLYYDMGTWWVEDLGSAHGTIFEGEKLRQPVYLYNGATLRAGDTQLTVFFDSATVDTIAPTEGTFPTQVTVDESIPAQGISESERIALMSQIRLLEGTGTDFLESLVEKLLAAFPQAQRGGIVFHQDKELVPVAFRPVNRATVSFTLVRRAMIERKAFVWSRSYASLQSLQQQSLGDILAAMYAPILTNRRVKGVLYLDSSDEQSRFSEPHLAQLSEFATLTGQRIIQEGKSSLRGIPTAFISYSRRDKAWVERFAADLRRMPISIWFDERLRVGKDWEEQLATAIHSVDAFLLVISPDSMESEFVHWEIEQARKANKPIYPILLRPADIPESLQKIQYLDGNDEHYAALTAELTNDLYELIEG